jgi:DNA ligase D-like protein (predicted 3'-phosphoesterase)
MENKKAIFMIHKHQATRLHYDFRFEIGETLASWAVHELPLKPSQPILAIKVADHALWYRHFEGVIPEGHYGAGPVMVWDKGLYASFLRDHENNLISLEESLKRGYMMLWLEGEKLKGGFILLRISKKQRWLLLKCDDQYAIDQKPANWNRSIKSNKTLMQILKK